MMKPAMIRTLAALSLSTLGALWATPVQAQQHHWYDGGVRKPLWLDPAQVADFSQKSSARVLRPSSPVLKSTAGGSPVFSESAGSSAPRMALPGGVIVQLPPSFDDAQRQHLFARHGLEPVRQLGAGPRTVAGASQGAGAGNGPVWLVASPPGLPSLELANRLQESGDFIAATPNWWRQRTLK